MSTADDVEIDDDDWFGEGSSFDSGEDLAAALFSLGGPAKAAARPATAVAERPNALPWTARTAMTSLPPAAPTVAADRVMSAPSAPDPRPAPQAYPRAPEPRHQEQPPSRGEPGSPVFEELPRQLYPRPPLGDRSEWPSLSTDGGAAPVGDTGVPGRVEADVSSGYRVGEKSAEVQPTGWRIRQGVHSLRLAEQAVDRLRSEAVDVAWAAAAHAFYAERTRQP